LVRNGPGKEARLSFMDHALMANRNGLAVGAVAMRAAGHAERLAALALIKPYADRPRPATLGADKGYDSADFVEERREQAVTPHVAQNQNGRRSTIGRTPRHPGYAISQRIGKRIEEVFGWARRWPGCARCGTVGCPRSIGNSPWRWPPIISCGCPNSLAPIMPRPASPPAAACSAQILLTGPLTIITRPRKPASG
jgi:hypothetical protein